MIKIFIFILIIAITLLLQFNLESYGIENNPTLKISTDNGKYLSGSVVVITGETFTNPSTPVQTRISLVVNEVIQKNSTKIIQEPPVYQSSFFTDNDGTFHNVGFTPEVSGKYRIIATTVLENNSAGEKAFVDVDIKEFPQTRVGMGIFVLISFICGLLALIFAQARFGWSISSTEPLRFALLTLCSVIPIVIFMAADVQIGQDGPLGLVKSPNENFEWVINVGGDVRNDYASGIQIPVFILIFGIIGGYLRFLRKTSTGWLKHRVEMSVKQFGTEKGTDLREKVEGFVNKPYYEMTKDKKIIFNCKDTCDNCTEEKENTALGLREKICFDCFRMEKSCRERYKDKEMAFNRRGKCDKCTEEKENIALGLTEKICADCFRRDESNCKLTKRFRPEVKRAIFNNAMQDLALIFLPPIVALVIYFIFLQGRIADNDNYFLLAAMSLGVGLVTKEALERIEEFVGGVISSKTKEEKEEAESELTSTKKEVKTIKEELELKAKVEELKAKVEELKAKAKN